VLGKVAAAVKRGAIAGQPDPARFAPNQAATRADLAVFVHQALVAEGLLAAITP
jgi:hypothetical protein